MKFTGYCSTAVLIPKSQIQGPVKAKSQGTNQLMLITLWSWKLLLRLVPDADCLVPDFAIVCWLCRDCRQGKLLFEQYTQRCRVLDPEWAPLRVL